MEAAQRVGAVTPYRIDAPALIQFSGGRSSGFMLRKILDAFDGVLPDSVRVCFCNTGLEHAATYAFIRRVETEWGVPIHWLEYRNWGDGHRFKEATYDTACIRGEPFEQLIRASQYLPNPVTRKCTAELKIRTAKRYAQSLGWDSWTSCIGLRADESRRVAKMRGDIKAEAVAMPMAEAGHTIEDVRAFWRSSPFDLELPGDDAALGNCVGCFLKSRARLQRAMRADPVHFEWWVRMEALDLGVRSPAARVFRQDRPTYAVQLDTARRQQVMFEDTEESLPCMCTD